VLPKKVLLHQAAQSVGAEISAFVAELMDTAPPRETMEHLAELHTARGLFDELSRETFAFVRHPA
jgi:hypothetical protein